jgi:Ser/Thr protein kinase RdoA (MazF antagonist)
MLVPVHDAVAMNSSDSSRALAMAGRFRLAQPATHATALGDGHIHDSFLVTTQGAGAPAYVLQRLNRRVFPDVARMARAVERVTTHQHRALAAAGVPDPARRALTVVATTDGAPLAADDRGDHWRAFVEIPGARSHHRVEDPHLAREISGVAARFLVELSDLPGPPIEEAIPGFHDLAARREAVEAAVAAADRSTVAGCEAEIDAVRGHASVVDELVAGRRAGRLPERTVHNDAKADNVLVDERTGEGLCMIDLDTVGPGTVLFDFGDLVRSMAAGAAEDDIAAGAAEDDIERSGVRRDLLEAVAAGYLDVAAGVLTGEEIDLLPLGGLVMTWEAASRFLADHLEGDVYYRVDRRGHNLDRARAQLRLLDALVAARPMAADVVGTAARAARG